MDTNRHPICPHTLHAVRNRKLAFRVEVMRIAGGKLDRATVNLLVNAGERVFSELSEVEMPPKKYGT